MRLIRDIPGMGVFTAIWIVIVALFGVAVAATTGYGWIGCAVCFVVYGMTALLLVCTEDWVREHWWF